MINMKKFFLGVIAVLLGVSSCTPNEDKVIVIGAAMNSFADTFQTFLQDAIREEAEKIPDLTVKMTDGKFDPGVQLAQIETMIAEGVDAIVVVPVDDVSFNEMARKVDAAGIPLVVANRLPQPEAIPMVDVFVGSVEIEAGRLQGEFIRDSLESELAKSGEKIKIGILRGIIGQDAEIQRTAGFREVMEPYESKIEYIDGSASWDRSKAVQLVENWLQADFDRRLKAIVANNDEMAIGAVLAARQAGYVDEDLLIVGVDASPEGMRYLGKGLDMTYLQDARKQGALSLRAAYALTQGEPVPDLEDGKYIWIPFEARSPSE